MLKGRPILVSMSSLRCFIVTVGLGRVSGVIGSISSSCRRFFDSIGSGKSGVSKASFSMRSFQSALSLVPLSTAPSSVRLQSRRCQLRCWWSSAGSHGKVSNLQRQHAHRNVGSSRSSLAITLRRTKPLFGASRNSLALKLIINS